MHVPGAEPVVRGVVVVDQRTGASEEILGGEVILCAGSVGSPWLLQLSGVGDAKELEQNAKTAKNAKNANETVRVHLPDVGKNLEDHLEYYLQYLCREPVSLYPIASTFSLPAIDRGANKLAEV